MLLQAKLVMQSALSVCLYDIVEHAHRLFGAVNGFCDSFKLCYPDAKEFLKSAAAVWEECQKHWDRVAPILDGSDAKAPS